MTPEVVLFDVDGTLLDTREFILTSFEHAFATGGLPVPSRDVLVAQIGLPLEQIYRDLAGDALAPHLADLHRSFQTENLDLATPFPGVVEVLSSLVAAGITLAAVTSRSRRTSLDTLDRAGLTGLLSAVVSAEDAPALKPHPAPLQLALVRARAVGMRAAMIGDTAHDIEAGRSIGALTVAALYGIGPAAALAARPDRTITDITELPAALGL